MRGLFLALIVFSLQTGDVYISSPQPSETLRGEVEILGNLNALEFTSAELAFSYAADASNPAQSWFVIQTFTQPPASSAIAVWDTTALTDGDYALHLRVFFQDGSSQDFVIPDLKIRNDAPLPTPTLTETPEPFNPISTPTSQTSVFPTITPMLAFSLPTPLAANPAALTTSDIYKTFAQGALIAVVLFGLMAVVLRYRQSHS